MKKNLTNSNLNININRDDAELNDFLYCWDQFGSRPNKVIIHNTYLSKSFNEILNKYILDKNFFTEIIPTDSKVIINDKMFLKIGDNIFCSFFLFDRNLENSVINEITFFYAHEENFIQVQEILTELDSCIIDINENENKINTIGISSRTGLEIEPIESSEFDIDNFNLYYHDKTFKNLNKLVKLIKKSDKGLSILYGKKGTGKTSFINYLSNKVDRIVIFIPNSMIEQTINNSEFRKILKMYDRPIIVIDDCEMLFSDIFTKSNMFSNNLLQMVDGFLSDLIEINVVAIFNEEDESQIDHCLLECNNLLKVIKFEYLLPEESTQLSKYVGHNKIYKNKTRVLDIIKNKDPKEKIEIGLK